MQDRPKKKNNIVKLLEGQEPNALHQEIYKIKNNIIKGDYAPAALEKIISAIRKLGTFKQQLDLNKLDINLSKSKSIKR